jgi:hypothetical protein
VTESTALGQEIRNTIDPPILRNNETNLDQTIDTQLLLNNKNSTTAEEFIDMIRKYNTYGNSSINEVGAYIINRAECQYKTKRVYQNVVCVARTKEFSNHIGRFNSRVHTGCQPSNDGRTKSQYQCR